MRWYDQLKNWSRNCTLWKLKSDDCISVIVLFIDEIRALPFIWPPARVIITFENYFDMNLYIIFCCVNFDYSHKI